MGHFSTVRKTKFAITPPGWLKVGAQITELVNEWSKRSDIITFVGKGAGMGHAACYIPDSAEMEIDVEAAFGKGTDPEFVGDLTQRRFQFDYPAAMGAVMHEAYHAKVTRWSLRDLHKIKRAEPFVHLVVTDFEETRIEARAVKEIPKNRAFLRACALDLVMGDMDPDEDLTERGVYSLVHLALVTLARVDAGVLKKKDVKPIRKACVDFFGAEVLKEMQAIWVKAQAWNRDYEFDGLVSLARELEQLLKDAGLDPETKSDDLPDWLKDLLQSMIRSGSSEPGSGDSILQDMSDEVEVDAQNDANQQWVDEVNEERQREREAQAKESQTHSNTASNVFSKGVGPSGTRSRSTLSQTRQPTSDERSAAVALSKELDKARYRDRVVVKRSSVIPPGRLNSRRAVAAAEQRHRGVAVTAEAWKSKQRRHTEDPELSVGILVDISGSRSSAMQPMASTAWILSEAIKRIQGKASMIYFGNDVFPVLKPGQHLDKVNIYTAPDGTEEFDKAFQAADGVLNLLNGRGARLLVIVSDLCFTSNQWDRTKYWMDRCYKAGVAVIVVPFAQEVYAKSQIKEVKVPVEVISHAQTKDVLGAAHSIGQAAVKQLSRLSR